MEDIYGRLDMDNKMSETNKLVYETMLRLYGEDRSGRLLRFFITKLIAISKLKGYGIDDENKLYVVTKTEYERLKENKDMKCERQVVDDRAFEKNYNIEWFTGNGKIATTSAVMTSIENGYIFFRYPSGGIFMVKDEAIRSLECLE